MLFAGYTSCIFGFSHVHIIDGTRIVHSHPYGQDHESKGHSQVEIVLLAFASHFVADGVTPEYFDFTSYQTLEAVFEAVAVIDVSRERQHILSLRAPPVV